MAPEWQGNKEQKIKVSIGSEKSLVCISVNNNKKTTGNSSFHNILISLEGNIFMLSIKKVNKRSFA